MKMATSKNNYCTKFVLWTLWYNGTDKKHDILSDQIEILISHTSVEMGFKTQIKWHFPFMILSKKNVYFINFVELFIFSSVSTWDVNVLLDFVRIPISHYISQNQCSIEPLDQLIKSIVRYQL